MHAILPQKEELIYASHCARAGANIDKNPQEVCYILVGGIH